jgi:hypothetical protein
MKLARHAIAAVALALAPLAHAQSTTASQGLSSASAASIAASGLVVRGSLAGAEASGQFLVASIETVGESTVIVLRGVSNATEASVQLAGHLARDMAISVGTVVTVLAEAVGYALLAGGRLIAYVPNEAGRALLHHARIR